MRFLSTFLLYLFLSFTVKTCYGQFQNRNHFSNYQSIANRNNNTTDSWASLYTNRNSSVAYLNTNYFKAANSYSCLPSATYASERTSVENGAIIGGLAGFVVGGVVGGIASPETNLAGAVLDLFLNDEENNNVIEEQVPYIVVGTLAGVAVGALIGKKKKE